MRVAYITTRAVITDGWGRYTVELIRHARQQGIEPVLISASPDCDPSLADLEHYPILRPVLSGRFNTPRTLLQAPQLRQLLKTCDVVHCLVELYAPLVALARPQHMPYFLTAHGTWAVRPLESRGSRLFFVPGFRAADAIIAQSRFTRDWMAKLMRLPRTEVISGGVIPAEWQREVKVALPDWVQDKKIALTAGAVKTRKGQQVVIEALAIARQQFPDLHYVIVGSADEKSAYVQQLKAQIQALGLSEVVHWMGIVPQEELIAWMQRADVFVLPSINDGRSFEGLGLVYLEAGAAGTPSIGSQHCGAIDAIMDGESGLLVPQNDPQATAAAILKIVNNPALRDQMGRAARHHAERLTWENLARQIIALYQEGLNQRGKRG